MTKLNVSQTADLDKRSAAILARIRESMPQPLDPTEQQHLLAELGELTLAYGRAGVAHAVRYWCDSVIIATPGAEVGRPLVVRFATPDNEELLSRRYIQPERRWAADALAARFSADHVRLYELVDQLPRDRMILLYLYRMAEVAAAILNHYDHPTTGTYSPGLYRLDPESHTYRKASPS